MNPTKPISKTPPRSSRVVFLLMLTPIAYGIARRSEEVATKDISRQEALNSRAAEAKLAHLEEEIFRAAQRADGRAVKAYLATPDGQKVLSDPRNYWYDQVASRRNGAQTMQTFWRCGIKPKPGELNSALRRSVRAEEATSLWLLSKGARIEDRVDGGNLMRSACFFGREKLLVALIRAGGNVNSRSVRVTYTTVNHRRYDLLEKNWSLLMTCAQHQQLGTLKLLLSQGADPNAKSDLGNTALKLARDAHWRAGETVLLTSGAKE